MRGYPEAMAALAEAGQDLGFLTPEQIAYGWCHTFHPGLVPTTLCRANPQTLILSSLKLGVPVDFRPREFLEAAGCPDPEVARPALEALAEVDRETSELLCDYALSRDCSSGAREALVRLGHLPAAAHRRQIFLIRLGMTDRAEELDPQGEHLVTGALELRPSWRLALAAHLRERGRGHLVARILGLQRESMQPDPPVLREMLRQNQLEALWTVTPFLPLELARQVLLELDQRGFSGGPDLSQAVGLAREVPPLSPVFRVRGEFLGWGGGRLYHRSEKGVQCLDWRESRQLWCLSEGGVHAAAIVSPDGMWVALRNDRHHQLFDSQGRPVSEVRPGDLRFSPCSGYCLASNQLWRLSPLERLREVEPGFRWFGPGQGLLASVRSGLHLLHLASNTESVEPEPDSEAPVLHWYRRGDRLIGALASGGALVVEADGSQRSFPGKFKLLEDGRLVLLRTGQVWDGRVLRPLPLPQEKHRIDCVFGRLFTTPSSSTGVVRLGDTEPYRVYPGRLLDQHPSEPYLATLHEGEVCLWHVPLDVPLSPAHLDHPDPLARFLLSYRYRHEVALEEGLTLSPAHEIELEDGFFP